MGKTKWILAAIMLGAALLLGACKSSSTPEATTPPTQVAPTATEAATEAPQAQPQAVGTPEPGTCKVEPLPSMPIRAEDSTDWARGASTDTAKLTIYEYSDFQCPGCKGMEPVIELFLKNHPDVRLVYRHFPLDFHQHAKITSEASEAAGAQGKFWEMHDLLFNKKEEWVSLSDEDARKKMIEYAKDLDLDVDQFTEDLDKYADKVQSEYDEARALGLPGTPTFIFNDIMFPSDIGLSYNGLESFMTFLNMQDRMFKEVPPTVVDEDKTYQVTLHTSKGDIVIELDPTAAPTNANNFLFLAKEKWYDGSDFFFVQDNFVAVTGDPSNSGIGYPGYYCTGESQGSIFDQPGTVGILGNGQFFITLGSDAAQLDGKFARIGQVTQGMDVAQALTRVSPSASSSEQPDELESVTITEK